MKFYHIKVIYYIHSIYFILVCSSIIFLYEIDWKIRNKKDKVGGVSCQLPTPSCQLAKSIQFNSIATREQLECLII